MCERGGVGRRGVCRRRDGVEWCVCRRRVERGGVCGRRVGSGVV